MAASAKDFRRKLRSLEGFGPWASDPAFLQTRTLLQRFSGQKLRLVEFCGGLSTGFIALSALGLNIELVALYDTHEVLLQWLRKMHSVSKGALHVGLRDGDICNLDFSTIPQCDIFIAGPPCPPWSSMGNRHSWSDEKSIAFTKTLEAIISLSRRGLSVFIIENVEGIANSQADGSRPITVIIDYLKENLGTSHWTVEHNLVNALDFGVPQSRPRVFITGRKVSTATAGPPALVSFQRRASLSDVVLSDPPVRAGHSFVWGQKSRGYGFTEQSNVKAVMLYHRRHLMNPEMRGKIACFPPDRTTEARTGWNPGWTIDYTPCLTAHGPKLHLLSLGCGATRSALAVDRALVIEERAALQGFPKWLLDQWSSEAEVIQAIGNAMCVPVLASVVASQLISLPASVLQTVPVPSGIRCLFSKSLVSQACAVIEREKVIMNDACGSKCSRLLVKLFATCVI